MKYKVIRTVCDCHPETCCCYPYSVVDKRTGEVLAGAMTPTHVKHLIKSFNKGNK